MCQKCRLDLETRTDAYAQLLAEEHPVIRFWQEPVIIIGSVGMSFALGALVIGTKGFGLWH